MTKTNNTNKPPKQFKKIAAYFAPYWKQIVLSILLLLLNAIFDILPTVLTGNIIDKGIVGGNFELLLSYSLLSIVIIVFSNALSMAETYINTSISHNVGKDIRNQLYSHLMYMPHSFFTTNQQGDIITRMTSDIAGIENAISAAAAGAVYNIFLLVASITAMLNRSVFLACIAVLFIPLFLIPAKSVAKKRRKATLKAQKASDAINQMLNQTLSLSGQQLVKLFTNESREISKFNLSSSELTHLKIKEKLAGRWYRLFVRTFINLAPVVMYLGAGFLLLKWGKTEISIGDITILVVLMNKMYRPVNQLLETQENYVKASALFTRVFHYLDKLPSIKNIPQAIKPPEFLGNISFENVCFGYSSTNQILHNLSFSINAGETVAIVGSSGSGKTTLTNLLTRMYDVTQGAIKFDGYDIRNLDLSFLRKNIAVVTQDSFLFNESIRENLLYANPFATNTQLIEACKKAHIHHMIQQLPEGYETITGNRGVKLSGGERQRISLARAILRNPQLLILDEATSALDSVSEKRIQQALQPLLKEKTALIIAHRLSTVVSADKIIVIEKGQIAEQGRHEELLNAGGVYSRLYQTQMLAR